MPLSLHISASTISPGQCPLCGQINQCAMAVGLPPENCWCMQANIAPQTLARIPEVLRRSACICPSCGQATPPINNNKG